MTDLEHSRLTIYYVSYTEGGKRLPKLRSGTSLAFLILNYHGGRNHIVLHFEVFVLNPIIPHV